jgi:hypothetical protein
MSKLKVNELDTESGTTITVTTTKTLDVPAGASLTVEGTANLTSSTLTLPATLPATAGTNITSIPGANITGTIPAAALSNVDTTGIEADIALLGFKVAVNGSLGKYNLVDQTEDAFMDATGIDASASTNEFRAVTNYYSGGTAAPTGGTITTYSSGGTNYVVHTFLADGTFLVGQAGTLDYVVVGGGGGGGGVLSETPGGGGGGAGAYRTAAGFSVTALSYSISVGDGGTAGGAALAVAGGSSIFSTITSTGGGAGGSWNNGLPSTGGGATAGGSGGGAGYTNGAGIAGTYGTAGGVRNDQGGGGGGGASVAGATGPSTGHGGNGGAGTASTYRDGTSVTYAGGGGGGAGNISSGGASTGGTGGGGAGGAGGGNDGTAATANTGSGGGGAGASSGLVSNSGGAGGKGIVVLRYVDGSLSTTPLDMTLQSNATTAETTPTKGDIVMTYTNGAGTATLNTDLTAEFSANDGTNWTSMTLVAQGSTGTHLIVSAHDVTVGTAGTAMKYRIKTLNQGAVKETRIQAVSLGWS